MRCPNYAVFLLALLPSACRSPLEHYEHALEIVQAEETPSGKDVRRAESRLDKASAKASKWIRSAGAESRPSRHDANAYVIPLASVARARLYKRLGQIRQVELACWQAVLDAEIYLGCHLQSMQVASGAVPSDALGSSVFFRREKIRRHVFVLLKDAYREAGEKDLEALMNAQVGFSDAYLRSPVAHGEEQFIRKVENSAWLSEYDTGKATVRHNMVIGFVVLAQVAAVVAAQQQRAELDQQAAQNPGMAGYVQQQQAALDWQQMETMRLFQQTMDELQAGYEREVGGIEASHKNTVAESLTRNFQLVGVSEEVKSLPQYAVLQSKKEEFDNYVLRRGFDEAAADQLIDMRSSLDELTRELQQRRRG